MNYIEEMRKKYFSQPLHKFNYRSVYASIVSMRYAAIHLCSFQDFNDMLDFCTRHNCFYYQAATKTDLGLIIILYQIGGKKLASYVNLSKESISFATYNN